MVKELAILWKGPGRRLSRRVPCSTRGSSLGPGMVDIISDGLEFEDMRLQKCPPSEDTLPKLSSLRSMRWHAAIGARNGSAQTCFSTFAKLEREGLACGLNGTVAHCISLAVGENDD